MSAAKLPICIKFLCSASICHRGRLMASTSLQSGFHWKWMKASCFCHSWSFWWWSWKSRLTPKICPFYERWIYFTCWNKWLSSSMRARLWTALCLTWQTCTPGERKKKSCYALQAAAKFAERLDTQSGNSPWWVAAAPYEFRSPAAPLCHAFPFSSMTPKPCRHHAGMLLWGSLRSLW